MATRGSGGSTEGLAPAMIVFTVAILLVIAGLHLIYGISELADNVWRLDHTNGVFTNNLWVWGIVDVVFAVVLAYAAADVLRGGETGRIVAIIWIGLSMIRWLYWIPAAPLASVVILIIDAGMLYTLCTHEAFFKPAPRARGRASSSRRRTTAKKK